MKFKFYSNSGKGDSYPLQYSCLEDPMDRGDWQTTVHRVAKSWTQLKRLNMHAWTVACQAPLSMRFSRQEYWSRLHFLFQAIFLIEGSNPRLLCLLHWEAGSLPLGPLGKPLDHSENSSKAVGIPSIRHSSSLAQGKDHGGLMMHKPC